MIRTGFVKEKKGEELRVCFERPEACEGCKGCSKSFLPKKELLLAYGEANIGDMVDVEMPEGHLLRATLLAYALPLLLLIAGLVLGTVLKLGDMAALVLAFAGLALGYVLTRGVDKKLRKDPAWRATVVTVYPMQADKYGKEE